MTATYESVVEKIKNEAAIGSQLWYPASWDEPPSGAIEALVENNTGAFVEALYEDIDDCLWECANWEVQEAVSMANLTEEEEELYYEQEVEIDDEVRTALLESDHTDYGEELARRTPAVRVMVPLIDEDDSRWGSDRTAEQLIEALGGGNLMVAQQLIDESPTDLGMAYIVADVPAIDLYHALGSDDVVFRFTDPCVIYGNPFTGGIWDARFEGVTVVAREIMPDGAWGYSVDDVYGGYECDTCVDLFIDGKAA